MAYAAHRSCSFRVRSSTPRCRSGGAPWIWIRIVCFYWAHDSFLKTSSGLITSVIKFVCYKKKKKHVVWLLWPVQGRKNPLWSFSARFLWRHDLTHVKPGTARAIHNRPHFHVTLYTLFSYSLQQIFQRMVKLRSFDRVSDRMTVLDAGTKKHVTLYTFFFFITADFARGWSGYGALILGTGTR